MRMRRLLLLLSLVLVLAGGCRGPRVRHVEERSQTIAAGDARALEVSTRNGTVEIQPGPGGTVEIKGEVRAEAKTGQRARELAGVTRLAARRDAERVLVTVEDGAGYGESVSVHLRIQVPRGLRVAARTQNGAVRVGGIGGAVDLETSNGAIDATDVVDEARARSSNGRITLDGAPGKVSAQASNGAIVLKLRRPLDAPSQVTTQNGSITVELGARAGAQLIAEVGNGSIRIDPSAGKVSGAERGHASGRLGVGGESLRLQSSNGSIAVRSLE
jgi:DUF4097 and DUF4098 domain-containing protein YvlB